MTARSFALVFGILYLGAGLLGLMPGMLAPPPDNAAPLAFDVMHGVVLGLFTVNMLHTAVHLAIGAWGLWAAWVGWRQQAGERRRAADDRRRSPRAPIANERRQGLYDRRRASVPG